MARHERGLEIKSPDEIRAMRRAGLVVAQALEEMRLATVAGATTSDIDAIARDVLASAGATSSFLGYDIGYGIPPYPATICISVNDEVVHGIPSSRVLVDGDLVSIDFGAVVDGWHGDAAITVAVGSVEAALEELSAVTRSALWRGIATVRPQVQVGDISAAVEASIRSADRRYGIVAEYTGHGIGTRMHMSPDVPNLGRPRRGPVLPAGVVVAIEPIVTLGQAGTEVMDDEWTVVTVDSSVAAHWEHTVAITSKGAWVLTAPDGGEADLAALGLVFAPLGD